MRRFIFHVIAAALSVVTVAAVTISVAGAQPVQIFKTYVSMGGSGTACTFAAPCGTFQDAVTATLAGGEIACLDSGNFPTSFSINKSLVIDCAGTAATIFNMTIATAGVTVTIRNLTLFGAGAGGASTTGIDFLAGAALIVDNCVVRNFGSSGIRFRPSASGSRLVVRNSLISENGSGSSGGGIVVNPTSVGTAQIVLDGVLLTNNVFGFALDGSASSGGMNATVSNSKSSNNSQDGILATSNGAPIGVYVKSSQSLNNAIGIRSIGGNVIMRVDGSSVIGNGTGLSAVSGGSLLTFGNNVVRANGSDGAFTGSVALQ